MKDNLKSYYDASLFLKGILNPLEENMVPKEEIISNLDSCIKFMKEVVV